MKKKSKLFVLPAFVLYTALMILPIAGAFYLSLTNWNGIAAGYHFIGLQNYRNMLSDARLGNAIIVTLKITITVSLSVNIFGLLFAILLNKSNKITAVSRSLFFLPYILSTVAISFIWLSILSYTGVLNSILQMLGLENLINDYIGNTKNAIISICIVEIWRTLGFYIVLYLASIQTVPSELYESCMIDGGNSWQKFRYVTLPMIIPGITIAVILSIMTEMRQYDIVKVLTNGGPGYSTETITYNIVTQAFGNNMLGYSSAIAVFLFVIIAAISILQIKISERLEGR